MPMKLCDCCGEPFENANSRSCSQCHEALGLLPEEVKWMLERIVKNRLDTQAARINMLECQVFCLQGMPYPKH